MIIKKIKNIRNAVKLFGETAVYMALSIIESNNRCAKAKGLHEFWFDATDGRKLHRNIPLVINFLKESGYIMLTRMHCAGNMIKTTAHCRFYMTTDLYNHSKYTEVEIKVSYMDKLYKKYPKLKESIVWAKESFEKVKNAIKNNKKTLDKVVKLPFKDLPLVCQINGAITNSKNSIIKCFKDRLSDWNDYYGLKNMINKGLISSPMQAQEYIRVNNLILI